MTPGSLSGKPGKPGKPGLPVRESLKGTRWPLLKKGETWKPIREAGEASPGMKKFKQQIFYRISGDNQFLKVYRGSCNWIF
jgi:hypothetical protein